MVRYYENDKKCTLSTYANILTSIILYNCIFHVAPNHIKPQLYRQKRTLILDDSPERQLGSIPQFLNFSLFTISQYNHMFKVWQNGAYKVWLKYG